MYSSHRMKMQQEIILVNNVPTKLLTWGNKLHEIPTNPSNYIICIPGSPGLPEFYVDFLKEIHTRTKQSVWIIGHAGHEYFDTHFMPSREENAELYSLPGQIKHKILFIENFVPKNVTITLIGHSMGSYMILKALRNHSIHSRVVQTYLLFPAIESLAETNNGTLIMNFWRHLEFAIGPVATFFNILPQCLQQFLIKNLLCKRHSVPDQYGELIRNFLKSFTLQNYASMGMDEMYQVRERDNAVLKKHANSIKLYYGASDNWAPVNVYEDIKKDIPNIDAQLCDKGIPHAFIFQHSNVMANILIDWMKI